MYFIISPNIFPIEAQPGTFYNKSQHWTLNITSLSGNRPEYRLPLVASLASSQSWPLQPATKSGMTEWPLSSIASCQHNHLWTNCCWTRIFSPHKPAPSAWHSGPLQHSPEPANPGTLLENCQPAYSATSRRGPNFDIATEIHILQSECNTLQNQGEKIARNKRCSPAACLEEQLSSSLVIAVTHDGLRQVFPPKKKMATPSTRSEGMN